MNLRLLAASLALAGLAITAHARGAKAGAIEIDHPHARATVAGQRNGGAYLRLDNHAGAADRLVSVTTDAAEAVELHSMKMDGDVMRMREIDAIDVPAGKAVELKPGGLHLMLIGLKQPLKAGDRFPMTLRFEKAGDVTVEVAVEDMQPAAAGHHKKH